MLIVPVAEGLNWRRPPPVTMLLIVLNVLVFFLSQGGDEARAQRAVQAYLDSSLPAIELPLYLEHLRLGDTKAAAQLQLAVVTVMADRSHRASSLATAVIANIQADTAFARKRRNAEAASAQAATLAADRSTFDALWARLSSHRFGFIPAEHSAATWITSQFLHGDLMHLLGNMVFLFIVGVAVESALGSGWTLALYLAGGVAANALFFAIQPGSTTPLIGASGAISGLMGLFTVVFGLRRVRFFYWVLFVFGFRRLPGLVMLPVWIAYELLKYLLDQGSRVAYMAHAGGLIGGALLGLLVVRRGRRERVVAFHEDRAHEASEQVERARARTLVARLDFKAASAVFAQLAERAPADEALLIEWHAVAKSEPAGEAFHRVVALIVALPQPTAGFVPQQARLLADYLERARPEVRLDAATLAAIGLRMTRRGEVAATERVAEALFKMSPRDASLPEMWALLAKTYERRTGEFESRAKAARYLALLGARQRAATAR